MGPKGYLILYNLALIFLTPIHIKFMFKLYGHKKKYGIILYSIFLAFISMKFLETTPFSDITRYNHHFSGNYSIFYTGIKRFITAPVEIGFLSFSYVINKFTFNSSFFYFVISFIYFYSISRFIEVNITEKNLSETNVMLALMTYYAGFGFYHNLYLLKQTMALSFFLLALVYRKESRVYRSLFFLVLSISFHKVMLIVLPYYIMKGYTKEIKIKIRDLINCILLIFVIYNIILVFLYLMGIEINFSYFKYIFSIFIIYLPILDENLKFEFIYYILFFLLLPFYYLSFRLLWIIYLDVIFLSNLEYYIESFRNKKIFLFFVLIQIILLIRQFNISLLI